MTVTEQSSRKVILGAGWANPLTSPYVIEQAAHVHVFADNVELVQGVDYTVTNVLNPAGYAVTITNPGSWAPTNWVLDARPPIDQGKDLTVGGTFGAKYEDGLDKLARRVERVFDLARRGLKTGLSTAVGDNPYTLPAASANGVLGWNPTGTDLETKTPLSLGLAGVIDDVTLAGDDHVNVPSQHAVKTYVDRSRLYAAGLAALLALPIEHDPIAVFDGNIWNRVAYAGVSTLVTADTVGGMYGRSTADNTYAWVRQSDTIALEYFCPAVYPADATAGLAAAFAVFKILQRTVTARAVYKSTALISLTNTFLDIRGTGERDAAIVFTNSGGIKVDNSAISDVIHPISIENFGLWTTTVGLYNALEVVGGGAAYANQVMCRRLDTNSFFYAGYWAKHAYLNNAGQSSFDDCNICCPVSRALPSMGISTTGSNLVTVTGGVYLYLQYAFDVDGTGSFMVNPGTFILGGDYVGRRLNGENHLYWSGCHASTNLGCWVITSGNHYFFTDNFIIPNTGSFIGFDVSTSFGQITNNQIVNANLLAGTTIGVKARTGTNRLFVSENIWYGLTNGVVVDAGANNVKVFDNEVTGGMTAASGLSDAGTGTQFRSATTTDFNFNKPLLPFADDGAALGSTAKEWSDLFLATGGVINWGAGDVTVTHSAGTLATNGNFTATGILSGHFVTVTGATVPSNGMYLPSAGQLAWAVGSSAEMQLTSTALSPFVSDGSALGTTALQWSDLFLATGGVINFGNGNSLVTHSSGSLAFTGVGGGVTFDGSIRSSHATAGVGYTTGAGGTVTQATSRTTGVTLNKASGAITMFSAAGSATAATFTVTSSAVVSTDTIILNQKSGTNLYNFIVTAVAAGSFNVTFYTTGGTAVDAPVINFNVIKGVAA